MGREIIALENEEVRDQPILTLLDDRLRQKLGANSDTAVLCLRPEIPCSTGLLEWLEAWTRRFRNADKAFFIVPANPAQLECLEVSHPEMELSYVASLDELDTVPPQTVEAGPEPVAEKKEVPAVDNCMDYTVPAVLMKAGSIVKLAGEYVCPKCKISRMWLKGDIASKCENPECRDQSAGWVLTCELF